MPPTLGSVVVGLVVLALVFWPLERLLPSRKQPTWRPDTPTDLAYWFFTPLVTGAIGRASLIVAVVLLAFAAGVPLDGDHIKAFAAGSGRGLGRQPVWLQVIEVLLLGDLIGYWSHRLFHGRGPWRFHVPWSFGPLRYVVSSPVFHRWHHTMRAEGLDKNFAGLFAFIDLAFGTFYMPRGQQPAAFGIEGHPVPKGLFAQLCYPFRRQPRATAST